MVDNKNNGTDDFDEEFDVDDISDADYDEASFDEDLPADDVDMSDEDFNDEWQDDEKSTGPVKRGGEKKGLSFNTIVILGAVVLGVGVLVFNVMSKTDEQRAAAGGTFQSMIDISGIMDGTLFSNKGEDEAPAPTEETPAQPAEQGFLNAPETTNPPQPTPIMPTEEGNAQATPDALTPMPGMDPAETPRGPEEETAAVITAEPTQGEQPATPPRAEDILKRAMENRQQREEDKKPEEPPAPVTNTVAVEEPVAPPPQPVQQAEPVPVQQQTALAKEAVSEETSAGGTKILQALENKIGEVLSRMDGIESDLDEVKTARGDDYKKLEDRMASMQKDIDAIKARPASAATSHETYAPVKATPKKQAKKTPAQQDRAYYPAPAAAPAQPMTYPSVSATPVWELRAAQPGRAWVSKTGSKDMQGVVVGETLSGVGKITGILYQNGRWIVQGTQGQILQ